MSMCRVRFIYKDKYRMEISVCLSSQGYFCVHVKIVCKQADMPTHTHNTETEGTHLEEVNNLHKEKCADIMMKKIEIYNGSSTGSVCERYTICKS